MRRWILVAGLKDFCKADSVTETNNAEQLNINSCWWGGRCFHFWVDYHADTCKQPKWYQRNKMWDMLWFKKWTHHPSLHTDTPSTGTVSSPRCTRVLIYMPAKHKIQFFNYRLLVHSTPMIRASQLEWPVKRGKMHCVGPLNGPCLHVDFSVYLKSILAKSKVTVTAMCGNTRRWLRGQVIVTGSVSHIHTHTHKEWKPVLQA